jgi:hypothetical protein
MRQLLRSRRKSHAMPDVKLATPEERQQARERANRVYNIAIFRDEPLVLDEVIAVCNDITVALDALDAAYEQLSRLVVPVTDEPNDD